MYGHDPQHADQEHARSTPRPAQHDAGQPQHAARQPESDAGLPGLAGPATRPEVLGTQGLLRLQREAGNAGASTLFEEQSPVLDVIAGGGRPLDTPVRADMEARLGHSFADVRIHTGAGADQSARSVQAHAYTVGSNVVFQDGRYDPSSAAGRTLLAHELTHVVQQRSGPVDGAPAGGGIRVSDPSDRFEREAAANAERVMVDAAPVQRQETPDEADEIE
jgi:hypothetical protein